MKTKRHLITILFVVLTFSSTKISFAIETFSVPAMPSAIVTSGGPLKVCSGENRIYTVTAVAGCTYNWVLPDGVYMLSGVGQNSILVNINFYYVVTSIISVTASNSMGTSPARTLSVPLNNPGTPGYVTGTLNGACAGTSHVYSVPAVAGINYSWTSDVGNISITAGQGTNTITATFDTGFTSGNLIVNGYNNCGTGNNRTQLVMSVPKKPGVITGSTYGVCASTGTPYSVVAVANATSYSWSATGGATLSPSSLDNVYAQFPNPGFISGTINVVANNSCGSSAVRSLTVNAKPATPTSVTGNASVCNGSVELYCANGSYGATSYTWTIPYGATQMGAGACIQVLWGSTGGYVKAKANNACGSSGNRSLTVMVTCRDAGDALLDENFSIYPNPASNNVTISAGGMTDDIYSIVLSNLLGQVVNSQEVSSVDGNFQSDLDLTDLTTGLYFVIIQSATMKKIFKIEKN